MSFKERWQGEAGYREVIILAFPLILSTGSWTLQNFIDRMFLSWYSADALAASMPAGMLSFTIVAFFTGAAAYVNTFVAQYYGAGRFQRIGTSVWQAMYFSLMALIAMLLIIPCAGPIFAWAGHGANVQKLEVEYFQILCYGAVFAIFSSALSTFFSGRGKTWPVMWGNFIGAVVNIVLDYAWIFGNWGFPEWGIVGAGWATVVGSVASSLFFLLLFLVPSYHRKKYAVGDWHFDRKLFKRLMRYGLPSGFQFMLDMLAFTIFIFLVGRVGTRELAATNLAFQVNTIVFLPMIGFGVATSTLVGQNLGNDRPDLAVRSTWSAFHLTFFSMTFIALFFVITPSWFIDPFGARANPQEFAELKPIAIVLLRFIAVYTIFDTVNIIFGSALKGAGDTAFVMYYSCSLGWLIMVAPTYYLVQNKIGGIYSSWFFLSLFICVLGSGLVLRFLQGKWKEMRVIE